METIKKQKLSTHVVNAMIMLFAALRILNYFYSSAPLQYLSAILLLTVTAISFPHMKRSSKIVVTVMFAVGALLLFIAKASFTDWLSAFLKNGDLMMLLICVPMISGPFYYEDYQGELKHLAQVRMQNVMGFLVLVSIFSHIMGVIVSIGAVIIVYELLIPFAELYKADKPFVKTLQRAYSSSGFWSPAWASVIIYSAFPDVHWVKVIPVGILFAGIYMSINLLGIYVETRRHPDRYPNLAPDESVHVDRKKLIVMLILAVCMVLSIVVVNVTTHWPLMLSVSVVSIVFPICVALIQRNIPAYKTQISKFYNKQLFKVRDQLALYIMAGFLGKALSVSGVGELITKLLPAWMTGYPAIMVMFVMLLLIFPTFVGVHPAASGTALVAAITPAAIGLTNYTFGLSILAGWLIANLMGPFSSIALILSGYTGRNNYELSIGSNWKFGVLCLLLFSVLISIIGPILG